MTETPGVPAGWYPDGSGQFRYYDGTAWTAHVHPAVEPQAEVVAEAVAEQPATQAAAPAPEAEPALEPSSAGAPSAPDGPPPTPWYRRPLVVGGAVVAVVVLAGAALAFTGGEDDGGNGGGTTTAGTRSATYVPVAPASPVTYGASPSVVASAVACGNVRNAQQAESASPVKYQRVTCTLDGAVVEVDTYPSRSDQETAESALKSFIGSGSYAVGEGWIALDDRYSAATAEAFAKALGGTVRQG